MSETSILPGEVEQFARHGRRLVGPRRRSGDAAQTQSGAAQISSATRSTSIGRRTRCSLRPLEGKSALDVGCGAGLLAEPLARLGAKVTAIDAAPELIAVAREPCRRRRASTIDYRARRVEELDGQFDLVTSLEVIEHVADPPRSSTALAARLAPGGLLILSTPNRTGWSKLLTITLAEGFGRIPKGTHDYDKFIAPERMKRDARRGRARGASTSKASPSRR